ncbi:MAG: acyl-CoA dehydrogenase family protein [Sphingopyxis sp.]|uniref:acyl-CoA dehydrogenase family protein n=1 Tax=Sphingopyxis sp. TaxID=1908224 RepID=UPI002ABBBA84|nr:acyl-CoA dehydrogenase family protein [Sphingopyxis sp.]MDZ3832237.1 acyl-CoA dehydrogenase family protein [Sphingopyxis sp.]
MANGAAIGELDRDAGAAVIERCRAALNAVDAFVARARAATDDIVARDGAVDAALINRHQHVAHGFAWMTTYAAALRALLSWAEAIAAERALAEIEQLMLEAAFAEYVAQLAGGLPMSQAEIVRPADMGLDEEAATLRGAARGLRADPARIAALLAGGVQADRALGDEMLDMMADQFRRFVDDRVAPHAHGWHLANAYIPIAVVEEMAALGVFGLTIPEEFGGAGLGKLAMCLVSEELSRGYIGVGSLGTRSEIAAELIRLGGTDDQRAHYLPRIASGEILPTAVFTEPGHGSDLAALRTRAERRDGRWIVNGNKTWITHAARSDLMTLLVRTNDAPGYRGLSMLLADKPRGDDAAPFPAPGLSGSEIAVLGYRGMKEYEIAFDGFALPEAALLGGVEGQGFKQLMETFESARIQTAARAVGVAQNALELALSYAQQRVQFAEPLIRFPRVANKIGWMAVETMVARQLSYAAARAKDEGRRCDIEAGMAKLLAARVAWSNADNAVQVHGGNGFALEFPVSRLLCDARILSIFEGAAEIQAQVIARGMLGRGN